MALFVSLLGAFFVIVGLLAIAIPAQILSLLGEWRASSWFVVGAGVRVVLGVLLLIAAPHCRKPTVVRVVGVFALVAALTLLAVGPGRFESFTNWWLGRPPGAMRIWSLVGAALGVLLIWAGRRRLPQPDSGVMGSVRDE